MGRKIKNDMIDREAYMVALSTILDGIEEDHISVRNAPEDVRQRWGEIVDLMAHFEHETLNQESGIMPLNSPLVLIDRMQREGLASAEQAGYLTESFNERVQEIAALPHGQRQSQALYDFVLGFNIANELGALAPR